MKNIKIKRTQIELYPDSKRVLLRPFHVMSGQRASEICAHILALPEDQVETLLRQLWAEFGERHKNIRGYFRSRFEEARPYLLSDLVISEERALLLCGYLSDEYSYQAAALFNPSMVPHPDQSNLARGSLRFVLSLRGTGEAIFPPSCFAAGLWISTETWRWMRPPVSVWARRACPTL